MNSKMKLRIGTRGSKLALNQTQRVIRELEKAGNIETEIVVMKTHGDKLLDKPLADFGGKGAFVTEFEEAILNGEIDLAVHSAKDMPVQLAEGLCIGGVLKRTDPSDVLVFGKEGYQKYQSAEEVLIGTGSLRRQCQIQQLYPSFRFKAMRGNVTTRIEKMLGGEMDGLVLAYAGLERLGILEREDLHFVKLSTRDVCPSAGQGIIAVECREDPLLLELLQKITDPETVYALEAERAMICSLNAGCHDTVGAHAWVEGDRMQMRLFSLENNRLVRKTGTAGISDRIKLAEDLANQILLERKKLTKL